MLDGQVLGASQVEYKPFGKPPLQRDATYVLFARSVRHRIGRFYRAPTPVHQEVDMGRAVSVLLFCVAMDPIYVVLNAIPGVLSVKGYMDDNATCGTDGLWLSAAQRAFTLATTAGFQVLGHDCIGAWSAESAGTAQPPWGARILASGATMLGLPLHGHGQDLVPSSRSSLCCQGTRHLHRQTARLLAPKSVRARTRYVLCFLPAVHVLICVQCALAICEGIY